MTPKRLTIIDVEIKTEKDFTKIVRSIRNGEYSDVKLTLNVSRQWWARKWLTAIRDSRWNIRWNQRWRATTFLVVKSDWGFETSDIAALSACLEARNSSVKQLQILSVYRAIATNHIRRISQALAHPNCAVTTLILGHGAVTDGVALSLAKVVLVQPSCKLEAVSLHSSTNITEVSIIALAAAIQSNRHCRLTKLELYSCGVTNLGAQALLKACATPHCKITSLNLAHNTDITDDCVPALRGCLLDPSCALRDINLKGTSISEQGKMGIMQALQQGGGTVHMGWQQLTDNHGRLLSDTRYAEFTGGHVTLCLIMHDVDYSRRSYYEFLLNIFTVFSAVRCSDTSTVTIRIIDDDDMRYYNVHIVKELIIFLAGNFCDVLPSLPDNVVIDIGDVHYDYRQSLIAAIKSANGPQNLTLKTTSQELIAIFRAPVAGAIDHRPGLVERNFHLTGSPEIDAADKAFYAEMYNVYGLITCAAVAHEVEVATELVQLLCKVWPAEQVANMYTARKNQQNTIQPTIEQATKFRSIWQS